MLNQTLFALDVATKVLDYYEEYYGIRYPLNKSGKFIKMITEASLYLGSIVKSVCRGSYTLVV